MTDLAEVAKSIDRIHNAYASLPQFARSTQVKRVMVLLCVNELDDALEAAGLSCRLSTGMLVEALNAAADGKRTELFALPSDEVHRSRDDKIHQYFQAAAAALLEAAFTDCRENQGEWAERIADKLARAGFRPPRSRTDSHRDVEKQGRIGYSGDAVKKWRVACIKGKHPATEIYWKHLNHTRTCGAKDGAGIANRILWLEQELTWLVAACESWLGAVRGPRATAKSAEKGLAFLSTKLLGRPLDRDEWKDAGVIFPGSIV